ncbi:MAG: hypothetical protein ACLFMQ_06195, partial [Desulfohalobiaceae bacterium]
MRQKILLHYELLTSAVGAKNFTPLPGCGTSEKSGKIDIIRIDSDYDNHHDHDLLCPPLAVVVVIVIDILTNTSRVEVFH